MIIGSKDTVAFEIGKAIEGSPDLRPVDIWLGGLNATYVDNAAYLPSFSHALERDLASFSEPERRHHKKITVASQAKKHFFKNLTKSALRYKLFNLGPTTDDLRAFAFTHEQSTFIAFKLHLNTRLYVVSIGTHELTATIASAICACRSAQQADQGLNAPLAALTTKLFCPGGKN